MSDLEKRKFINPTPGYVGAVVIDEDGKRQGIPVEPGGAVWLSELEMRLTAEAPRLASDNPFVKEWEEAVEFNSDNQPIRFEKRTGVLVASTEPPRPIAGERFVPGMETAEPEPEPEEVTGDDGVAQPTGPAPQGTPAPGEIIGTPDAPAANDAELAARAAREAPTPVTERPAGSDAIRVPPKAAPLPV